MSTSVNTSNFMNFVSENDLVVVKFSTPWCAPCKIYDPIIDQFAQDTNLPVGKVNLEESPELGAVYGIMSVPQTLVFKHGNLIHQIKGIQTVEELTELVK